jgi:hypothetical protein
MDSLLYDSLIVLDNQVELIMNPKELFKDSVWHLDGASGMRMPVLAFVVDN